MNNQTLQTLDILYKRFQDNGKNKNISFQETLERDRAEIAFFSNKFKLKDEESLLLVACCIEIIEHECPVFNIIELAYILRLNNFEILLCQEYFRSLFEKGFLVEVSTEHSRSSNVKSIIDVMNKTFALHPSFGEHFS